MPVKVMGSWISASWVIGDPLVPSCPYMSDTLTTYWEAGLKKPNGTYFD